MEIDYELLLMMRDGRVRPNDDQTRDMAVEMIDARRELGNSSQCACCQKIRRTPLRRDDMGGYVCLSCVDKRLTELEKLSKHLATRWTE